MAVVISCEDNRGGSVVYKFPLRFLGRKKGRGAKRGRKKGKKEGRKKCERVVKGMQIREGEGKGKGERG